MGPRAPEPTHRRQSTEFNAYNMRTHPHGSILGITKNLRKMLERERWPVFPAPCRRTDSRGTRQHARNFAHRRWIRQTPEVHAVSDFVRDACASLRDLLAMFRGPRFGICRKKFTRLGSDIGRSWVQSVLAIRKLAIRKAKCPVFLSPAKYIDRKSVV